MNGILIPFSVSTVPLNITVRKEVNMRFRRRSYGRRPIRGRRSFARRRRGVRAQRVGYRMF